VKFANLSSLFLVLLCEDTKVVIEFDVIVTYAPIGITDVVA